ncbi:MAG TPA: S41 family peptidase [Phycisphaerales bacterium]|nr:S41 family peptidase [Phycisphaerales bacterium]
MHQPARRRAVPALLWAFLSTALAANAARAFDDDRQVAMKAAAVDARMMTVNAWSTGLWSAAHSGDAAEFADLLDAIADGRVSGAEDKIVEAAASHRANLEKREIERAAQINESRAELDKLLAQEQTPATIIKALREALELQLLTPDHDSVLAMPQVRTLVSNAEAFARRAETDGDILNATEAFVLLDALEDISGKFRPDVRRCAQRQQMLRLYVPNKLWAMSNERRKDAGEKELPPYNDLGDDFRSRLQGVTRDMVERAVQYTSQHVEQVPMNQLVGAGLDALRTMATTAPLAEAFPGLADDQARTRLLAQIDKERQAVAAAQRPLDAFQVSTVLDRVLDANDTSTKILSKALLHEFGNGVMGRLDEYSAIIWPDEVARFRKSTEGRFVGIGVSIELDDFQNVRVVTPIEGTPAQREGIHPNDLITQVDGKSIFGLSLDQVVDLITGKEGTKVQLTIERPVADAGPDAPKAQTLVLSVPRAEIEVPTVKGWKRDGAREDAWDWFVDGDHGIGYVRVTQFSDKTTWELDRAISQMKKKGLNALIVDLRFNPGGLLDQAVSVAQRFLPFDNEVVVAQRRTGREQEPEGYTSAERATVAGIPVVVLVNEGSASASEIVSGAISVFTRTKDLDAVVLGARSFGKGSVQNVWQLSPVSLMKLTTAYYTLPDDSVIHRRPGSKTWGIQPNFAVEMLPKQTSEAITIRRNADVLPLDERGQVAGGGQDAAKLDDLLAKGIDLQLDAACVLLKARVAGEHATKVAGKEPAAARNTP